MLGGVKASEWESVVRLGLKFRVGELGKAESNRSRV